MLDLKAGNWLIVMEFDEDFEDLAIEITELEEDTEVDSGSESEINSEHELEEVREQGAIVGFQHQPIRDNAAEPDDEYIPDLWWFFHRIARVGDSLW